MTEYYQDGDKTVLSQIAKDMRDTRDRMIRVETKVDAISNLAPDVSIHGEKIAVLEDRDAQSSDAPARWGALVGVVVGAFALAKGMFSQ